MNNQLVTLLPLILLIFIMYFLMIRPQKKKEKAINAMRNAIKVGDEVVTIGGICGKIVKTKDETLTIQVGADKTKFEIMRWAVSKVVTEGPAVNANKAEEAAEEPVKKSLPKKMKRPAVEEQSVEENEPAEAESSQDDEK